MGKKARSLAKINKAAEKKIDKSTLPPPPPPPSDEVRDLTQKQKFCETNILYCKTNRNIELS